MQMTIRVRASEQASQQEKESFIRLVRSREAVEEQHVRSGIERPGVKLVFAYLDDDLAGVAALKVPLNTYRSGLGSNAKSGYALPHSIFPNELGYVAVAMAHEGRGLGKELVHNVVGLSGGKGLFATTSNAAMLEGVLPKFGFQRVGKSWLSQRNADDAKPAELYLMVRRAGLASD